ncbi:DUF3313 family protein [Prosthecobacter sp.]|uniref:DUF3313 family protein n=1 Tax=Prosthecobacter sp. TaxID=1965333 RepID=UPI002489DE90|nr:DUF3313 family protein [Prosthecobacter sp.]MDI1313491.1 DUF3313 family protein [Prosthecobacter sp.]
MMLIRTAFFLLIPWMMISCRTAKSVLAAVDVKPTAFLPHASKLKENRKRSPFLGNWWNTDKKVLAAAQQVKSIYIAPVVSDELRAMKQKFVLMEFSDKRRDSKMKGLETYTHDKFVKAFKSNKKSRYTVVNAPSKDAMTLKLSIIEWEPNTYSGLVIREALDMAVPVPFTPVGSLIGKSARPAIAIQGVLTEPKTGKSFFEFADKEETRMAVLLFFPNELYPTGQAKFAIREWASQFEKLMSSPPDKQIRDSMPVQIMEF